MIASIHHYPEAIEQLLHNNANINALDNDNNNALMLEIINSDKNNAPTEKFKAVAEILINAGININQKNKDNLSIFDLIKKISPQKQKALNELINKKQLSE